jgi:hypothetical protein
MKTNYLTDLSKGMRKRVQVPGAVETGTKHKKDSLHKDGKEA